MLLTRACLEQGFAFLQVSHCREQALMSRFACSRRVASLRLGLVSASFGRFPRPRSGPSPLFATAHRFLVHGTHCSFLALLYNNKIHMSIVFIDFLQTNSRAHS